ncbi:acetyl-CoA carboxylase, biotin carboxylase subunit [Rhizobium tibeticum]|uniref:Biotin carboxylase n=1 Tax=Rhizobium tibeticum TaxID=501024 RepID=A0A1H8RRL8_9HYPH|nr:acetyl-CoA carboxylase biotin carboxylase subunit [Rhizobium tibeticum]SEI08776.1 Biotin carboxylase [Rhizobium tibeticum]SEO68927.1 acetyl-CoA carboxylase, biotin carboxylase subunit [Rhizobium tibeticum]
MSAVASLKAPFFDSVLIANRGEIALRIQRACRQLGLRSIMVCSEADRDAPYRETADEFVCIGPSPAAQSYLNRDAVLAAAVTTGAGAIHPGYGFLSENAAFADAVEALGLTFIGPRASEIRTMGDKIAAKQAMMAAGVPCVPGPDTALGEDLAEVANVAETIGYPVIVKAAGGGGGRGMRVVSSAHELAGAVIVTREEARRAFGKPELYIEKFLQHPRHVEIQVLCDNYGQGIWLGARDCSMQRRHQKVVEEAPAPLIPVDVVARIGERCVAACRQIGYRGVGTFEFLYEDKEFYFIEMNTRLQVEHPVTEMTSGIDIVREQLRVAQGYQLELSQADVGCFGHSFECRINAEDPFTFAASPGLISAISLPGGPGVRVDTHVRPGYKVPPQYDSMIAKLVVHAPTRDQAITRMRVALSEMRVDGISTNIALHREIFEDHSFSSGGTDIHHLEKWLAERRAAS